MEQTQGTQASNTKSQHTKPQRAKCQGVKNTIESQKEQKGKKCFLRLFHPTQTSLSVKKIKEKYYDYYKQQC